ncbi:MAG: hypothetical protein AABY22_04345 [Nanoarchaeota archaeon]
MKPIKYCIYCNNELTYKRIHKKFCNITCWNKNHRELNRKSINCKICKNPFRRKKPFINYCSIKCRKKGKILNNRRRTCLDCNVKCKGLRCWRCSKQSPKGFIKTVKFPCIYCSKLTVRKSGLHYSMAEHQKMQIYHCSNCNRKFMLRNEMFKFRRLSELLINKIIELIPYNSPYKIYNILKKDYKINATTIYFIVKRYREIQTKKKVKIMFGEIKESRSKIYKFQLPETAGYGITVDKKQEIKKV